MRIRAIVFDLYQTLLAVEPPPADADIRWERLWRATLDTAARMTLKDFGAACDAAIAREHASASAAGVLFPEVFWPDIVREVVPELTAVSPDDQARFMIKQAELWHSVRLMPGARELLNWLRGRACVLGLASNCQPYTMNELGAALDSAGLDSGLFHAQLRFLSFEQGFSKPNPHAFRILNARLRLLGIKPHEALMVGDRQDNDIVPAKAHGWQTWRLTGGADNSEALAGDWAALHAWLRTRVV